MMPDHIFVEGPVPADTVSQILSELQTHAEVGAYNMFWGQVRGDREQGQMVRGIEFSAYQPMAIQQINRICATAMGQYDLQAVGVLHSLGMVPTGALCFGVWVAAGHRTGIFEATAQIIHEVKAEVPIFGKEWLGEADYQWKQNR